LISIVDPKWKLFIQLAELGSLSRTAVALDVPQSMVSRHLAQLEQDCGARLFRRTGRGVVLTEFGEQIFPRITAMIAQAEVLADDIHTSGGMPAGEVRVGLLPSTVPLLASRLFASVRERYPKIRLHLMEGTNVQLQELVDDGRLDMALLAREDDPPTNDEPILARVSLKLVGRRDAALLQHETVEFERLHGQPLVLPSPPHPIRTRLEQLARARRIELNMAIEADSIWLQHAIAAAGGGYAVTTGLAGNGALDEQLAAAQIVGPEMWRVLVLSTTLRRPHTLATREVYRQIQRLAPTHL
jgi:DNA-binding transcriptional LysR family regulator